MEEIPSMYDSVTWRDILLFVPRPFAPFPVHVLGDRFPRLHGCSLISSANGLCNLFVITVVLHEADAPDGCKLKINAQVVPAHFLMLCDG